MDFECSNYTPNEWNSAETLYNAAQVLTPASMEDYQAAVTQYNDVANAYDGVISKALPIYRDSRKAATRTARDKAVAAGADSSFADEMKAIDDKDAKDGALFEDAEYYEFRAASLNTENRYAVLETRAEALKLKDEIDENRLARFSQDIYDSANESADKAKALYNEDDIPAAKTVAVDALAKYKQAVLDGWKAYADEQSPLAQTARSNAVNVKADVAFEKDFSEADAVYSQGTDYYESQNYKSAADSFVRVQPLFAALAKSAADKQKAASSAVAAAQKKYTDSQNKAKAVPGTANNQYLTQSAQSLASAQKGLEVGDFEDASTSAAESQKNASLSDDYVAQQRKANEAGTALVGAKKRLDGVDAEARKAYATQYGTATAAYADGVKAQGAKNWDLVNADVKKINDALDALDKAKVAAVAAVEAKRKADEAAEKRRGDEAGTALVGAKKRLDGVDAEARKAYATQYGTATTAYADGVKAQGAKNWDLVNADVKKINDALDALDKAKVAAVVAAEAKRKADEAAEKRRGDEAGTALANAKRRLDGVDAETRTAFAPQYGTAATAYADGVKAQGAKNWDLVNADVKNINDALDALDKAKVAAVAAVEAKRKADEAAEKRRGDEAATALANAKRRLDWADAVGAEQQYTDQYGAANSAYNDALEAQKSNDWDKTTDRANAVVSIVDGIEALKTSEANDAMAIAKERLDWAADVGAATNYPDAFTLASTSYALGEQALDAEDWNTAIVSADAVMNALAGVSDRAALPAQYIVRTWEEVRDCLWNIAGYPWVYNDPFQWRRLYNANRDKLPNVNDASSIEPNTIIDIPSIRGETRSGIWEEGKTYPDLPR
jgi:hypothetical protein